MTVPPTPSEEDCRRVSRERAALLRERIRHTNRIRGLLFGQGIANYNPLNKNRRQCLKELRTGDGRSVPVRLEAEILREIEIASTSASAISCEVRPLGSALAPLPVRFLRPSARQDGER